MGALQSIPSELTEAARVDGGGAWQVFRRVTLPLLLVAVAPLMIASFAFNFNNFNNVYLLTGGGPYNGRLVDRGHDGHPDQLHVQARDRLRKGIRLWPGERGRDHHLLHRRRHLGDLVLEDQVTGEREMSTSRTREATTTLPVDARPPCKRPTHAAEVQGHLVAAPRRRDRDRRRALPGRLHRLVGVQPRQLAAERAGDSRRT